MKGLPNLVDSLKLLKKATIYNGLVNLLNTHSDFRLFHSANCLCYPRKIPSSRHQSINQNQKIPLAVSGKFKVFDDSDASVILDADEEIEAHAQDISDYYDEFEGINTKRGLTGVFDIEELVETLRRENAKDIFVAAVPPELKYVDYICIVSARSPKHILAMAEFIRRLFKRKQNKKDSVPSIEGKTSSDWMAMDLGNIALHIFASKTREIYDLETLWGVGSKYDSESRKPDDKIFKLIERHSVYLHDLKPAK